MSISSSFKNFSLPELFQIIDKGKKSGCLTVWSSTSYNNKDTVGQYYYVWFLQGRIVAASDNLKGKDLASKIVERCWLDSLFLEEFLSQLPPCQPLGLSLKTKGILSSEQLQLLFSSQVKQIKKLFEIQKGVFKLDSKANLPWLEMTGLSISTIEAALIALRTLKNWENLRDALPEQDSGIKKMTAVQIPFNLNSLEMKLLNYADSKMSLNIIAKEIQQSITAVQRATFRLMIAGWVEEVPMISSMSYFDDDIYQFDFAAKNLSNKVTHKLESSPKSQISKSFRENLFGFLRSNA